MESSCDLDKSGCIENGNNNDEGPTKDRNLRRHSKKRIRTYHGRTDSPRFVGLTEKFQSSWTLGTDESSQSSADRQKNTKGEVVTDLFNEDLAGETEMSEHDKSMNRQNSRASSDDGGVALLGEDRTDRDWTTSSQAENTFVFVEGGPLSDSENNRSQDRSQVLSLSNNDDDDDNASHPDTTEKGHHLTLDDVQQPSEDFSPIVDDQILTNTIPNGSSENRDKAKDIIRCKVDTSVLSVSESDEFSPICERNDDEEDSSFASGGWSPEIRERDLATLGLGPIFLCSLNAIARPIIGDILLFNRSRSQSEDTFSTLSSGSRRRRRHCHAERADMMNNYQNGSHEPQSKSIPNTSKLGSMIGIVRKASPSNKKSATRNSSLPNEVSIDTPKQGMQQQQQQQQQHENIGQTISHTPKFGSISDESGVALMNDMELVTMIQIGNSCSNTYAGTRSMFDHEEEEEEEEDDDNDEEHSDVSTALSDVSMRMDIVHLALAVEDVKEEIRLINPESMSIELVTRRNINNIDEQPANRLYNNNDSEEKCCCGGGTKFSFSCSLSALRRPGCIDLEPIFWCLLPPSSSPKSAAVSTKPGGEEAGKEKTIVTSETKVIVDHMKKEEEKEEEEEKNNNNNTDNVLMNTNSSFDSFFNAIRTAAMEEQQQYQQQQQEESSSTLKIEKAPVILFGENGEAETIAGCFTKTMDDMEARSQEGSMNGDIEIRE